MNKDKHIFAFFLRRTPLIIFIICFYQINVRAQSFSVNAVNPFSRIEISQNTGTVGKAKFLQNINQGQYKVLYTGGNEGSVDRQIEALVGESKLIAFEVKNNSQQPLRAINISIKGGSALNVVAYQQGLVNEWYGSTNMKNSSLTFYGDPLLKLGAQNATYSIQNLRAQEAVRIVLEVTGNKSSSGTLNVQVKAGNVNKDLQYNYKVLNKKIPAIEFASIAYNMLNLSAGAGLNNVLKETGFTHLQVNPIPVMSFSKNGEPISNGIDQTKPNSKSFRDIANNWVKSGGKLALYWQPRYQHLAPLANGGYIPPFTSAWNTAYVNLLREVINYLKKGASQFDESQLLIYLADEISEADFNKKGYSLKMLLETNNVIKRAFPNIKTMVTFGFYSGDSEVNTLLGGVDITTMHSKMPSKANAAGRSYNPYATKVNYAAKIARLPRSTSWNYNVEGGVISDIRDFWFLPAVSASAGSTGFSWWAFASHRGSTWTVNQSNGLNYSMYYGNEPKNEVFKLWTKGLPTQDLFIPSLRLKAAEAGLLNAKLILAIKNKQLNASDRQYFTSLTNRLKKIDGASKENMSFPTIKEIEEIGNSLREIYSRY